MRIVALVTLCVVLTSGLTLAQRGEATIRGVVVDAASDTPLRGVTVSATSGDGRARSARTTLDGTFQISLSSAGATVRIHASKARFIDASVEVPAPNRPGVPLEVTLAMAHGGAISGRIRATYGAGVPQSVGVDDAGGALFLGAPVLHRVGPDGTLTPAAAAVSTLPSIADVEARYRFGGLPPGRYVVSFESRMWTAPLPPLANRSVIVDLAAGQDVGGVDITMPPMTPLPAVRDAKEGRGTVRGYVLDLHRAPVEGALVVATRGKAGVLSVDADASGRFVFEGMGAGSFTVTATKPGYVGWPVPSGALAARAELTLTADGQRDGIELVMARAATINGRVVDEYGDPLQGAMVRLMTPGQSASVNLAATAQPDSAAFSDDRGVFRIAGVIPGVYIVSVAGPESAGDTDAAYPPLYYPGTRERASAIPITLDPESEFTVPELSLRPVPVGQVSGIVLTSDGLPATGNLRLIATEPSSDAFVARTATPGPKGEFMFAAVPAGTYLIDMNTTGRPVREFSAQLLTVTDTGVAPLLLRTRPGASISGTLVLEAAPGRTMNGYAKVSRSLAGTLSRGGHSATHSGPFASGDAFTMPDLWGLVRVQFSTPDEQWFLKSVIVNGVDVVDHPFDFGWDGRSYEDVQVTFSANAASISGRVTDARGDDGVAAPVVVFPVDSSRWFVGSRWIRAAASKADGAFTVGGLPPGEYNAVAIPALPNAARLDPTPWLAEWAPVATRIRADSATQTTLRVLPR